MSPAESRSLSSTPLIVIAAGGDGNRIGGDKPARLLGRRRLIDRMVDWATRHSDAVAVAVREGDGSWDTGLPVLVDAHSGIGPISALVSSMHEAHRLRRKTALLIGCDLPFLPDNLVHRLGAALGSRAVALPFSEGRLHPMAGLWRCNSAALERWIEGGGQSLWRYSCEAGRVEVTWPDTPDPFANINDTAALTAAEQRLKGEMR